jgi:hypothetical protein
MSGCDQGNPEREVSAQRYKTRVSMSDIRLVS